MPYLQGALICDAARDYQGKVSILGGFVSVIGAASFPFAAPIWYAGRVAFDHEEIKVSHEIIVRARSHSEVVLGELHAVMPPQRPEDLSDPEMMSGANIVAPLPFPIPEPGMYWVELVVDGQILSSLPLKAVEAVEAVEGIPAGA